MRIKQKFYPYPIMDRENNAYKEFSFNVATSVSKDGFNILFDFQTTIGDVAIKALIDEGKAVFAYHIQCAQTCYRAAFDTTDNSFLKRISEDLLNGQVEVCPLIILKEDIKGFSSENFSPDYMGIRFDIDKGGILAIGDQTQHYINKEKTDLANTSSIFSVISNPSPNEDIMKVDIREKKIAVVLPQEQFSMYKKVCKSSLLLPNVHAMIFVPALMTVLSDIKKNLNTDGDLSHYDSFKWFGALDKIAAKRFNKPLEELLVNREPVELAQMLLNAPLNRALKSFSEEII